MRRASMMVCTPMVYACRGTSSADAKKRLLASMVVSGENKAETVRKAFFGPVTPQVPASILQLHTDVSIVADEAALSKCGDLL